MVGVILLTSLIASWISLVSGLGIITILIITKGYTVPEFKLIIWVLLYDIEWSLVRVFMSSIGLTKYEN
jgi:hypothetical protein